MTFEMLQAGDRVFIDANIFLYHFGEASAECKTFLTRCSNREILGYTSTSVLATHDNDFDHISWLEIYKPTDVRP